MDRPTTWQIVADEAELAVEAAARAHELHIPVEVTTDGNAVERATEALLADHDVALVLASPLPANALVALCDLAVERRRHLAIALLAEGEPPGASVCLARDLGVVTVDEVRPLVSAMAILHAGVERPWAASLALLPKADRLRLERLGRVRQTGGGFLSPAGQGAIAIALERDGQPAPLGETRDALEAIVAIHGARGALAPHAPSFVEAPARDREVRDLLFGPRRALSDPASKSALRAYGVPVPHEELCGSPSRAAAEASRMGFPVRVALASPDLRLWDHPDLALDGVDGATHVRDVYRQLVRVAETRSPRARILGVTVTATLAARALLRAQLSPLARGRVLVRLGFSDAHALAAGDHTETVLPTTAARLDLVLGRLAGAPLLLEGPLASRRAFAQTLADVFMNLGAFVHAQRDHVESVDVDPLAVLADGSVEVREACVRVNDAFESSLRTPAERRA